MKSSPALIIIFLINFLLNCQESYQFGLDRDSHMSAHHQLMALSGAGMRAETHQDGSGPGRCDNLGPGNPCMKISGTCFCFVAEQKTWLKSYEFCQFYGMDFVSIETLNKQQKVEQALTQLAGGNDLVKKIGLWTSGTYVVGLNTFMWAGHFTLFSFANWVYGSPRLSPLVGCVRIVPTMGYVWSDIGCDQWLPSLCESSAP